MSTKRKYARNRLASAVFCSMVGLPYAAVAATVDSVNTDNLADPPVEGKTLVYTDTAGTETFGWFDPINDSGDPGLGISVYNEVFSAAGFDFQGCIMAQTDLQPDPNCLAPGDSGKRFKLKTTETNGPIDLVFDVTADSDSKLYRVIGKFSNLTAALNAAGGDLKAFRFETGFGVGNDFVSSSAGDGLSFGIDGGNKISAGDLGKFPGGLFGGSRVEGLPFFSVSVADFVEGSSTDGNEDAIETDGVIATEYSDLFGDWRALSQVPTGWFIDHDGNPANDSILLAWDAGDTGVVAESGWQTYQKVFEAGDVSVDYDGDETTDPLLIPIANWDPNSGSFAAAVTAEDGVTQITDYVENVRPLVETLGEGDEDPANDAISLVRSAAADLYVADYAGTGAGFKVLIDGEAVEIAPFADWADSPVTILDSEVGVTQPVFATWDPEALDGEGAYVAGDQDGQAYTGTAYDFSVADSNGDTFLTLDEIDAADPSIFAGTLDRQAGYVQGAVEDLANVNINTSINVGADPSWPTCTSDGTSTNCTFTLRVTGLNDAVEVPTIPVTPVEPEPEEPAAAPSEGGGTIFGCTAGKPGAPFDPVLPGLVLMALGGLWARKRLSNA
ncbi:choice-of-anchor F family protein [Marinobacter salsuginis]|uniref:choice-of-anchor F family protein n=1 Tax=Marinobacter salsuginis TaxID=418719 RepID=UPI001C93CFD6|nr:choice-of-anchor F family protein [Marinobacter salsuginis]MBY6069741.1 choice-of-anchor F family protein [Marinobacter salsuginis]